MRVTDSNQTLTRKPRGRVDFSFATALGSWRNALPPVLFGTNSMSPSSFNTTAWLECLLSLARKMSGCRAGQGLAFRPSSALQPMPASPESDSRPHSMPLPLAAHRATSTESLGSQVSYQGIRDVALHNSTLPSPRGCETAKPLVLSHHCTVKGPLVRRSETGSLSLRSEPEPVLKPFLAAAKG